MESFKELRIDGIVYLRASPETCHARLNIRKRAEVCLLACTRKCSALFVFAFVFCFYEHQPSVGKHGIHNGCYFSGRQRASGVPGQHPPTPRGVVGQEVHQVRRCVFVEQGVSIFMNSRVQGSRGPRSCADFGD